LHSAASLHHPHQPVVPLDCVDELSAPTALTPSLGMSRSASYNALASMFGPAAVGLAVQAPTQEPSPPPQLHRSMSANHLHRLGQQRSSPPSAASSSSSSHGRRSQSSRRNISDDQAEEQLLSQMQQHADLIATEPLSPRSGSSRYASGGSGGPWRASYPLPPHQHLSAAADAFPPRASSFSHSTSPSSSQPPSPRGARMLQSLKDSFGHSGLHQSNLARSSSCTTGSGFAGAAAAPASAGASGAHAHLAHHLYPSQQHHLAHYSSAPSASLSSALYNNDGAADDAASGEERKETPNPIANHTSAAAAAAMHGLHHYNSHGSLHALHHSHSFSGASGSGGPSAGVSLQREHSGLSHSGSLSSHPSSLPHGVDHLTLATDESPELSTLTRSSSYSSNARTQPQSPVSQQHHSNSFAAAAAAAAPPSGFGPAAAGGFHAPPVPRWSSYQFEPVGSQHVPDLSSVPWQPQLHQEAPGPHQLAQTVQPMSLSDPAYGPPLQRSPHPGAQLSPTASAGYCAVCLSDGCDSFLLPCQHSFHARCILQWVESEHQQPSQRLSCPLCRQTIEQFVPNSDEPIEDENGDLLARFLAVWEKHYYQRGGLDGAVGRGGYGGGSGGGDDGETLIKPGATQEFGNPQKQQQQQQQGAQTRSFSPTATPAQSPIGGAVEELSEVEGGASLEPLSAEQAAWQQFFEDTFYIPDSLPDDFIIPRAAVVGAGGVDVGEGELLLDDHAANIAAVDGGRAASSGASSGNLSGWIQTPLSLLSSFMSAFKNSSAQQAAQIHAAAAAARVHAGTPVPSPRSASRRALQYPRSASAATTRLARTTSSNSAIAERVSRQLFAEEEEITIGASPDMPPSASVVAPMPTSMPARMLGDIMERSPSPQQSPPAPYTPVLAGAAAGAAATFVQAVAHTGGPAFAPSPLYASMPAVAAYFTSYEMMKAELGLTPSLSTAAAEAAAAGAEGDMSRDPRAALLNMQATGQYFGAAATAGAVSNGVKIALSPGVLSLAGAFASTAQISARMGIQFSIFEQTKNAFALYRHRRVGEELNAAEVLVAASLGGVVAASIMYPIQHFIPLQHWALTAPPPMPPPVAHVPGAPLPPGGIGTALPRPPTLLACLGRFLPACVATAVTYEYAFRFIRNRTQGQIQGQQQQQPQERHALADAAGVAAAAAAASSASAVHHGASSPPSSASAVAAPASAAASSSSSWWSTPRALIDSIAARTSSLLHSVGVDLTDEEVEAVIPMHAGPPNAAGADAVAAAAHASLHPHRRPPLPTGAAAASSTAHVHTLGHALPVMHHMPAGLLPPPRPRPAQPPSRGAPAAGSGMSRSSSHPVLSTLRSLGANEPAQPPSLLDPW